MGAISCIGGGKAPPSDTACAHDHEACYTTVTTVCVPTKVNCSLISVVPMHAWLSNVVRLSRCRDRRPRNRPVLRVRPSTPLPGVHIMQTVSCPARISAPARPAHPGPPPHPRTRSAGALRGASWRPGSRHPARGSGNRSDTYRYWGYLLSFIAIDFDRSTSRARNPGASRRRPHARAAHIEAFHSFTHYVRIAIRNTAVL